MKKSMLYWLICSLPLLNIVKAQNLQIIPVNHVQDVQLGQYFLKYDLLKFQLKNCSFDKVDFSNIKIESVYGAWQLSLEERNLFKANFVQSIGTDEGIHRIVAKPTIRTFVGFGENNEKVCLSLAENFILGEIVLGHKHFFIEPIQSFLPDFKEFQFVLYDANDVMPNNTASCMQDLSKFTIQKPNVRKSQFRTGCLEVEIALACDRTVHDARGGINGAQNWATSILNLVQTNYDNEFNTEVQFFLSEIFVATSPGSDPWNSVVDIGEHLEVHRQVATTIYSQAFDVATAWTRKYTGGTVGLAYLAGTCSSFQFNVCSDFNTSSNNLRELQAHELGHNFSLPHDGGQGFIMSPSVNGSDVWSQNSIDIMNSFLPTASCLSTCVNGAFPIANFKASPLKGCTPLAVQFTDLTIGAPTSWDWSFPGGVPSSSTQQHPKVSYPSPGLYEVTLTVNNAFGSDSKTITDYIETADPPIANFDFNLFDNEVNFKFTGKNANTYLWRFGDGEISQDQDPQHNYTKDSIYEVSLTISNLCGTKEIKKKITIVTKPKVNFISDTSITCKGMKIKFINLSSANTKNFIWIFDGGSPSISTDKNPEVIYDSAGTYDVKLIGSNAKYNDTLIQKKFIAVEQLAQAAFSYSISGLHAIFQNNSTNASRYAWDFGDGTNTMVDKNPDHPYAKEGEYNVILTSSNVCGESKFQKKVIVYLIPKIDFVAEKTTICAPDSLQFYDRSSKDVVKWNWTFDGVLQFDSLIQNPKVFYTTAGIYEVSLKVENTNGSSSLNKKAYIDVLSPALCPDKNKKRKKGIPLEEN